MVLIRLVREVAQARGDVGLIEHALRVLHRHILMNTPVAERSKEPQFVRDDRAARRHVDVVQAGRVLCAPPRALNVPWRPPDVPPTSGRLITRPGTFASTNGQMSR